MTDSTETSLKPPAIDLPGILPLVLAGALVEFVANRLLGAAGVYQNAASGSLLQLTGRTGIFGMYLAGILATVLTAHGLVLLLAWRRAAPLSRKLIIFVFASIFLPTAGASIFIRPAQNASFFGYITAVLAAGLLGTLPLTHRAGNWAKATGVLMSFPLIIVCYSLCARAIPAISPEGALSSLPVLAHHAGEWLYLFSPAAVFFLLRPRPFDALSPLPLWPGLICGILCTAAAGVIIFGTGELFPLLAYRSLGLSLSARLPWTGVVYLLSVFLWSTCIATAIFAPLKTPGSASVRRVGYALAFIALSGIEPVSPYLFLLYSLGHVLLFRGLVFPLIRTAHLHAQIEQPMEAV